MLSSTTLTSMFMRKSLQNPLAARKMFQYVNSRAFSSYSKVYGNSIIVSNHHPPKLRIPVSESSSDQYDFSLDTYETVKEFEDKVKANASGINRFNVSVEGKKRDDTMLVSDVLK